MPQKLKFFALFAVLALTSLGLAKEKDMSTEDKSVDFEVDGQVRYRYEYWHQHPFLWNGTAFPGWSGFFEPDVFNHNYTNWQLLRSRIGVKASLSEDKFAYIQFQDARYFGADAAFGYQGFDGMTPDLHNYGDLDQFGVTQAYFQVNKLWESPFGLKIGRQFLEYDDQKLVGSDDWSNYGQSFDALKLMFRHEYFDGDLFYAQLWPFYPVDDLFGNINFFGLHGTGKYTENHTWSAFLYGYRDGNLVEPVFGGPIMTDPNEDPTPLTDTTTTLLWTLGTRAEGEIGGTGLGYAGQFAFQFGNWYQTDVSAFMFEFDAWYKFKELTSQPYFGAGLTYASGDDTADGDKNTFVRLFPSPHPHLGYMDLVGMQNIMSLGLKAGVTPVNNLSLHAGFDFFWLNKVEDGWYNDYGFLFDMPFGLQPGQGGGRGGVAFAEKTLGQEFDFSLKYKYNGGLWFKGGFSHFFTGGALEGLDDGSGGTIDVEDVNWIYLQTGLDF